MLFGKEHEKEKQVYAKRVNDFFADLQTNIESIMKFNK